MSRASAARLRLFDAEFLERLEKLRFASRQLAPAAARGEHRARRRGGGVEFADYRPYVEGDSLRYLDWGAFLRFDKLLVRTFEEEAELPVTLLLDCSRSMGGGPDSAVADGQKFDLARQLAAALGYIALHNNDRVHIVPFSDSLQPSLRDLRGIARLAEAFHYLEDLSCGGETDLGESVRGLLRRSRQRGLIVVLSDLLTDEVERPLSWLSSARHDVLLIHLVEPSTKEGGSWPRRARLLDREDGEVLELELSKDVLRSFRRVELEHENSMRSLCRASGWAYVPAPLDAPLEDHVWQVFRCGRLLRR